MPSREELIETVDQYLNALVARDPSGLALAPAVRFTENCIPLPLGKGLWATTTGLGAYKHYICDEYAGQAGFFGVVQEMGNPAIFAMRLKMEYRHITEIETLVARFGNPLFAPEAMLGPRSVFDEIVPPAERSPREELIGITNLYFDGIEQNDGSIIPLYPDAYRIENGVKTTSNESRRGGVGSLSIAEGISSGYFEYIPQIRDRRFPVVDEERGLSLGFVYFEHPGNVKSVDVPSLGKLDLAPFTQKPSTAMIAELFKIRGGKIQAIDAILEFLPYGIKSGWD